MDEDATWYGSRHRRRPHCIRRVPSAPRKGHSTPSFRSMSIVATVAHLSYCWALVVLINKWQYLRKDTRWRQSYNGILKFRKSYVVYRIALTSVTLNDLMKVTSAVWNLCNCHNSKCAEYVSLTEGRTNHFSTRLDKQLFMAQFLPMTLTFEYDTHRVKPWFHIKIKLCSQILVFYFNMEPRVNWNKIILEDFRPKPLALVAMLKQFYFISDVVPC